MLTFFIRKRLTISLIVMITLLAIGVAASILMHLSLESEPVAPDGRGMGSDHLVTWVMLVALVAVDIGLILRYRKAFLRKP